MRIKKSFSSISLLALLPALIVLFVAGSAVGGNYDSIYSDFEGNFTPGTVDASGDKITMLVNPAPYTFKAFVPPGATRATMIIYGRQGKVFGAVARADNTPQCAYGYNQTPSQGESLPWDAPKSGTLSQMRSNDYQMNNIDGQIEVLDWGWASEPLTGNGHWVYVKMLNFETTIDFIEVNFTVNVDIDAYTTWYNTTSFVGTQPPDTPAGPTGDDCESDWLTPGSGGSSTPAASDPDISVSITSPGYNEAVQGVITLGISTYSDSGTRSVVSVIYKVDGVVRGAPVTSSPFSMSYDTSGLSNGSHSLTATVTDSAGEASTSGTSTFIVDNSAASGAQDFDAETFPISMVHVVATGEPITVQPTLVFSEALTGVYDCYAAYAKDGDLFLAEEDVAGEPFFLKLREGDAPQTFTRVTFSGDAEWSPTVFSALPSPSLDVISRRGVVFLLALIPVDGGLPLGAYFTFSE
ncbi:MAG: hypothetical protein GY859_19230 [Desulfobacterales bacterium]|nr:hypothetical protein [Desulfobacterales bacterium]